MVGVDVGNQGVEGLHRVREDAGCAERLGLGGGSREGEEASSALGGERLYYSGLRTEKSRRCYSE